MMGLVFLAGCGKETVRNGDSGVHKVYATARRPSAAVLLGHRDVSGNGLVRRLSVCVLVSVCIP